MNQKYVIGSSILALAIGGISYRTLVGSRELRIPSGEGQLVREENFWGAEQEHSYCGPAVIRCRKPCKQEHRFDISSQHHEQTLKTKEIERGGRKYQTEYVLAYTLEPQGCNLVQLRDQYQGGSWITRVSNTIDTEVGKILQTYEDMKDRSELTMYVKLHLEDRFMDPFTYSNFSILKKGEVEVTPKQVVRHPSPKRGFWDLFK